MGVFQSSSPPFFTPAPVKSRRGRLAVFYYVPRNSPKYNYWRDGFTAAFEYLSSSWTIDWIHADTRLPLPLKLLKNYDAIYVKSNWGWRGDKKIQRWAHLITTPCFLVLSDSLPPPEPANSKCYTHVFYETSWYAKWQQQMPPSSRAFGVDTSIYYPKKQKKKWDVLGIGALRDYKRWDRLASRPGRKLVVGDILGEQAKSMRRDLEKRGVEVRGFQAPETLRDLIGSARLVYIPAALHGGGERAVWEARACGVPVEVESDNPKLNSLLSEPLMNQYDYAEALLKPLQNYRL